MRMVILAAGAGRALYPLTRDRPKALLEIGGVTLLERLLAQAAVRGLSAVIVVGWGKAHVLDVIRQSPTPHQRIDIVENPIHDRTSTLYSLWLARELCDGEDLIVADGDLVCDEKIVTQLVDDPRDVVLAVDHERVMGDEEVKVVATDDGRVIDIGKTVTGIGARAEFLGMAKYSAAAARELFAIADDLVRAGQRTAWAEEAVARLTAMRAVQTLDVAGLPWAEIDFLADYVEALRTFGDPRRADSIASLPAIRRQRLFCPGPVLVSRRVKSALAAPEIGHRELEFSELLNRVRLKLGKVYGVRNFHRYTTVVITGSGTAANEAVLGTAGVGRRLLVLANGEFGERLLQIARHHELDATPIVERWGQPFSLAKIEAAMASRQHDAVVFVHHETSTGMLNPLAQIAELARRYRLDTFVDAVSSIGGVPIDVDAHGLTFVTGSASKAIGAIPGLAFVCGQRDAFEALATVRARSLYLDLYRHYDANDRRNQTPNTPAVNLYFALEAALDDLLVDGLERRFAHFCALSKRLRRGFRRLGLRPFIPEPLMSPLLTTLELPRGFGAAEFHDRAKDAGYIVYPGKGILHDRVFQVANIGALTTTHCDAFLRALGRIVEEQTR